MDLVPPFPRTLRIPPRRFGRCVIISLFSLLPAGLGGQTPAEKVLNFLENASGFYLMGEIHEGALTSGHRAIISLPLIEGADYIIVAYCDEACSNLDLILFDSAGAEIQSDRLPDPEPVLMLAAESTGHFYVQVNAIDCQLDGCRYALGILGSTEEPGAYPGEDMTGRLALVGAELEGMGFSKVEEERRGSLITDQAITFPVTLQGGMEYRVVGVCDIDCFDLDLALIDPDGKDAASDFLNDALPLMAHIPDTTTDYQVEVMMVACDVHPCAFRVATYVKEVDPGPGRTTFSGEVVHQETIEGKLESTDEELGGAYLDVYQVEARAGQRIIVNLRSDDFDTLLRLLDPKGTGPENDDYGFDPGHSRIEMLALEDGVYSIQVTSFETVTSGDYVLHIAVVE